MDAPRPFFSPRLNRSLKDDEEPLDIKSWLTLYQGDGPPRTAISCFEPKPNRAKDIRKGDVFLNIGSPRRVLKAPSPPDADGEVLIKVYDIAADETTDFIKDTIEDTMTCTTRHMRYSVVCISLPVSTCANAVGPKLISWPYSEKCHPPKSSLGL